MSIRSEFLAFQHLYENPGLFQAKEAIACLDLTILDNNATQAQIEDLATAGNRCNVAAFCVYPHHLDWIKPAAGIKKATVINFPEGQDNTASLLKQIDTLKAQHKLDEIDYVFPWKSWLLGHEKETLQQAAAVYNQCQQQGFLLKIIMETGGIDDPDLIHKLASQLLMTGADFLKTSTGKIPQGASPEAAYAILSAIKASKQRCGLKVSGGIKTPQQAFGYMALAEALMGERPKKNWFRIGASSLLNELIVLQ